MFLRTLKLTNFKNYAAQALEFSARLNCLTGLNGMGKTNVLDAIHFLCLSKNHLGSPDRSLVRQGVGRDGILDGRRRAHYGGARIQRGEPGTTGSGSVKRRRPLR